MTSHLDYAAYGSVIVPLLFLPPLGIIDIMNDESAGRCRIVNKLRKRKKIA